MRAPLDRSGLTLDQLMTLDPSFSRNREQIAQLLGYPVDDDRFAEVWPNLPEGQTYVLDRIKPAVRGNGIPARYNCRCIRCDAIFVAKVFDVVRRIRLCCQPQGRGLDAP